MSKIESRREFLQKVAFAGIATAAVAASPRAALAQDKNEAIEAILTRRSIRKFKDQAVSEADIDTLVRCAMAAPSANTTRSRDFVVVTDKAQIEKFGYSAPLAILCCANNEKEFMPGNNFGVIDTTCSIENILVAANALGLGACWKAAYPFGKLMDKFKAEFGLPENVVPVSFVIVGHPAEEAADQSDRYVASAVHKGKW